MKKVNTKYIVRHIKNDTYLRYNESKYGKTLSLSDFEYAEQFDSLEKAKEQSLIYCREKKTMDASMFEILKVEITYKDVETYELLPTKDEFDCYQWGLNVGPALKIKEDGVKELLIKKYKLTPKSFTFRTEVRNRPLYYFVPEDVSDYPKVDVVYIIVENIVWDI